VYGLLYPYWVWICLRAKSLFFFSASNPTIENGGFLMESKKRIYDLIPQKYYPRTLFFRTGTVPEIVWQKIEHEEFTFPLVGKPDIGMRGMEVKKLHSKKEVIDYITTSKVDFLIQEFVPYEMEAGIFYYRLPNEKKGHISGIVHKEFLTVKGDGKSTIFELLKKDKRYILQLAALTEQHGEVLNEVLPDGVQRVVVPYGNHCRGAKFIDASHQTDEELTKVIDEVCGKIDGFYYGRMDIRFQSWEDLKKGKNFSLVELNGAGSEPTHIYDPKHTIFFAWKEIIRHWHLLYKISKQNRQKFPYMDFQSGVKMFRDHFSYLKLLNGKEGRMPMKHSGSALVRPSIRAQRKPHPELPGKTANAQPSPV